MKNLFSVTLLMVTLFAVSYAGPAVFKGKTHSALGEFTAEKSTESISVDGVELETYVISYENSEKTVKVAIDKDKKGKKYLVICEDMAIQYVCKSKAFGIEKLDKKYQDAGYKSGLQNMNMGEFYHQRVITRDDRTERNCLGLIAVYFPKLTKDYEKVFCTP